MRLPCIGRALNNKVRTLIFIFLCSQCTLYVIGQSEISGGRNKGLGDQGLLFEDLDGYVHNSAALAKATDISILLHSENRFLGTGIKGVAVLSSLPAGKKSAFGAQVEYYGLPEYKQQNFRIGYGRMLTEKLSIGTSINLWTFVIPTYRAQSQLGFDFGVLYKISSEFILACSLVNPFRKVSPVDGLNSMQRLGIRYDVSPWVSLFVQFEKENQLIWVLKMGMEYWMIPRFAIRLGVAGDASGIYTGIGIKINPSTQMDLAIAMHPALGLTPALSIRYHFLSKEPTPIGL